MSKTPRPPSSAFGCFLVSAPAEHSLIYMLPRRKFFGAPNGTKVPPKQSKLAFSTKAAKSKQNEDVSMEDGNPEVEVKSKAEKEESADAKENVEPEKSEGVLAARETLANCNCSRFEETIERTNPPNRRKA